MSNKRIEISIPKLRSKEEIRRSMEEKGIINKDGTFTGNIPVMQVPTTKIPEVTNTVEKEESVKVKSPKVKTTVTKSITPINPEKVKKEKVEKVKKEKVDKKKKIKKNILLVQNKSFKEKVSMVTESFKKEFGDSFDMKKHKVTIDGVDIGITMTKMNIRTRLVAVEQRVGIRINIIGNGYMWTYAEYLGKISITYIVEYMKKLASGKNLGPKFLPTK